MKTILGLAAAACLALAGALTGCANYYENNHMASGKKEIGSRPLVVVMPFHGVSESPGSGLIVADVMANELYALGGFVVVTPEVVAARAAPREGETLSPEATGKMVGALFILIGRVTEYTYKSGVGEQPAVGVTARLIETDSGRVLWSASRARTGSAAWFQEDSLALLTSRICNDLAKSMAGNAKEYGWGNCEAECNTLYYPVVQEADPQAPKKPKAEDTQARAAGDDERVVSEVLEVPPLQAGAFGAAQSDGNVVADYRKYLAENAGQSPATTAEMENCQTLRMAEILKDAPPGGTPAKAQGQAVNGRQG